MQDPPRSRLKTGHPRVSGGYLGGFHDPVLGAGSWGRDSLDSIPGGGQPSYLISTNASQVVASLQY
jgi:hypothetical protein